MIYTIGHILFWVVFKVFFGLRSIGLDNVPKRGSCLLASNHVSFLDPPVIGTTIIHRKIYFIGRATLFRFPIFGLLLRLVHVIPIELKSRDRSKAYIGNGKIGLKKALELLEKKEALLVFPEGTRSPDGNIKEGKKGIGFLAYNSKVPVIPVFIKGSYEVLPKGAKMIKSFRKIRVIFGGEINLNEFYKLPEKASTYQRISDVIMYNVSKLNTTDIQSA